MQNIEEWRPIEGWPYEVSSLGRVRRTEVGHAVNAGRVLSLERGKRHYRVTLLRRGARWGEGEKRRFLVHRLVCVAFNGPPPSQRHLVAHNNGDGFDNRPSNLRWALPIENCHDTIRHQRTLRGELNGQAKLTDKQADEIRALYAQGHRQVDLAAAYGVSQPVISSIVNYKKYAGFGPRPALASCLETSP